MQSLLRGRILYVVLAVLVTVLYTRLLRTTQPVQLLEEQALRLPQVEPQKVMDLDTYEWWPGAHQTQELQEAIQRDPMLGFGLGTVAFFSICMGVGGFMFFLWGVVSGRLRKIWDFTSRRPPPWTFGELTRIVILVVMVAALMPFVRFAILALRPAWHVDMGAWIAISMLFLDGFVALTILSFTSGKQATVPQAFGLTWKKLPEAIRVGFRGYLAVFPWLFILLAIVVEVARQLGISPPVEPLHELIFEEKRPLILGMTIVLTCLLGPFAEELFFRGVVYATIRRHASRVQAMLISGALFSLIHTNLIGFLPIMLLGCLLAYLYERTGSLWSPLAVHIVHNTFLMTLSLLFRQLAQASGG